MCKIEELMCTELQVPAFHPVSHVHTRDRGVSGLQVLHGFVPMPLHPLCSGALLLVPSYSLTSCLQHLFWATKKNKGRSRPGRGGGGGGGGLVKQSYGFRKKDTPP